MHSCIAIFLKNIRYAFAISTYHIQKVIKFELMEDPNSNDMFVGANDSCSSPHGMYAWENQKTKHFISMSVELAANCLNISFHRTSSSKDLWDYKKLLEINCQYIIKKLLKLFETNFRGFYVSSIRCIDK